MNLLLINESLNYCHQIERLFSDASFEVNAKYATNMEQVANTVNSQVFDLAILSDKIGDWRGLELLLEVKYNVKSSKTALIVISENETDGYILDNIHAGAHGFIPKSELNAKCLRRVVIQAKARSSLEVKLNESYEKVKFLAEHDSLTGVANRYMFDLSLVNEVEKHRSKKACLGLVLINIERFKMINDTYGHHVGDIALNYLTDSINDILKDGEKLYRLGGDEFAIIITDLHYAHIDGIDQRIFKRLAEPLNYKDWKIKIDVNIGAAFFPQNADNAQQLLRSADIAEHCAKSIGSNSICFVDDDVQEQFRERYQIEKRLLKAVEDNELVLHYQPVLSSKTQKLVSCEALIRWDHPEKGLKFPDYFINIAEETGLIVDIGRWIINEALAQLRNWQDEYQTDLVMALNISPQQLYDRSLVAFLDKTLEKYSLTSDKVEIEITETVLLKNTSEVLKTLNALASRGYGIALDDFGTGFSSIQHLHTFPISTVKVDRSLMPSGSNPKKSLSLLKGLVSMLQSLELDTVAEGIETNENVELCCSLGVERLQGYYFSKPIPADTFEETLLNIGNPKFAMG